MPAALRGNGAAAVFLGPMPPKARKTMGVLSPLPTEVLINFAATYRGFKPWVTKAAEIIRSLKYVKQDDEGSVASGDLDDAKSVFSSQAKRIVEAATDAASAAMDEDGKRYVCATRLVYDDGEFEWPTDKAKRERKREEGK